MELEEVVERLEDLLVALFSLEATGTGATGDGVLGVTGVGFRILVDMDFNDSEGAGRGLGVATLGAVTLGDVEAAGARTFCRFAG